jgi:hypothetical protein
MHWWSLQIVAQLVYSTMRKVLQLGCGDEKKQHDKEQCAPALEHRD